MIKTPKHIMLWVEGLLVHLNVNDFVTMIYIAIYLTYYYILDTIVYTVHLFDK